MFEHSIGGKRRQTEIGLGGAGPGGLSLSGARQKSEEARRTRASGKDPLVEKRGKVSAAQAAGVIFGAFADDYVKDHRAGWSNAKHADQWSMTLGDPYCKTIRSKPIAQIGVDDVLAILTPVWQAKPETALRLKVPELGHEASGSGWSHPKLHPSLRKP